MRRLFIAFALAATSIGASATCIIHFTHHERSVPKRLTNRTWSFKNYEAICLKLEKANAGLDINTRAIAQGGVSVGWAAVSVKDKDLRIVARHGGANSTVSNPTESQDTAEELQYEAINRAIDAMDIDKGLISLKEARQQIKASNLK